MYAKTWFMKKKEQLPDADSPFHYEAEAWVGLKYFLEWLKDKNK